MIGGRNTDQNIFYSQNQNQRDRSSAAAMIFSSDNEIGLGWVEIEIGGLGIIEGGFDRSVLPA